MRRTRLLGAWRGRGVLGACGAVACLATVLAACGPLSNNPSGGAVNPGNTNTVTYAMQPGGLATYPFPFMTGATIAQDNVYNVDYFQYLLYRPLYWFGTGTSPYLNKSLSLAYPAKYSGHTVIIRLKPNMHWSNGETITAQDVVFWMNMMIAQGSGSLSASVYYSPTGLPADIKDVKATSKYTMTMTITSPQFSQTWFDNNMLSEITPMPMAWDVTANGPSDCVTKISDCRAVYTYLAAQSALSPKTYPSSKLWSVVDGPWKIKYLDSLGNLTLTYNNRYDVAPVAPHHITTFIEVPFTAEQSEYNVLQDPTHGQTIDVGYLPTDDAPVPPAGAAVGANPSSLSSYQLTSVYAWELQYMPYNYSNPTVGPIFSQLYFRQAFQDLVDQEGVINGPLHGYGKATIGPVGPWPVTSYLSTYVKSQGDQWPLNIHQAASLLASHGWAMDKAAGVLHCVSPGSGLTNCGPKVPAGAQLNFQLIYAAGTDWMESAVREFASNASLVGIKINLAAQPFNTVTNTAFIGAPSSWQLAFWGGWTFAPDYLPTGDELFETGVPNNAGHYSNATDDHLIAASLAARTPAAFDNAMWNWENWLTPQLPVAYEPDAPTLVETINGLQIGPQNSALTIAPEDWYYLK